jgi:hypothetical protein
MYRPMSSFMASRFVSATTPDNAAAPMPQFPEKQNDSVKVINNIFTYRNTKKGLNRGE